MLVLQIIYLAINVIGIITSLIYFTAEAECPIFSNLFTFIHKHFKNIGVVVFSILLIILLLPTITFMSAVLAFTVIYGTYTDR